ncbi:helix-turn-helix domain-containing protein [Paenibacillus sp. S150]|uniref:helix-turn-helix domain-containing protein n=1 Tax=Paenibacillus sp. S150 TaxID=2749826 RepID=UPI001C58BAF0|nr:helix-turn-helix domain-containing protein [Paenibacillus sp. S150]MBW4082517.1 response regulator [Paenibacillus sp. S150]
MYQLLIVDDEAFTGKVIAEGISWGALGITTVHLSTNIRMAKEVIRQHRIDLMICDIEMPQGSGLELMEWVKEQAPAVVCIFLTCHADFSYAQKAVQLGSFEYLLKPIEFPELEKAAARAVALVSREREKQSDHKRFLEVQELWSSQKPAFIEHFWRDLLTGMISSDPQLLREYMAKGDISYPEEAGLLPVLIRFQGRSKAIERDDGMPADAPVQSVMRELLHEYGISGRLVQTGREVWVLIAEYPRGNQPDPGNMQSLLQEFVARSSQGLNCELCCYAGEAASVHEMAGRYNELLLMDADNIRLKNRVLMQAQWRTLPASHSDIPGPPMQLWMELLKQNSDKALQLELGTYLKALEPDERVNAKWLREFHQNFLQIVYHVLHLNGLQAHRIFEEQPETSQQATRSLHQLLHWAQVLVQEAVRHARDVEKTGTVVDKTKAYILNNIAENELSREQIAANVYLNPDYLTRIFKKETGMTLSDFVVKERMERAKELLLKTSKPINSIASSIGYSNFSHFSRIFKKTTGLTPHEFRHKELRGN